MVAGQHRHGTQPGAAYRDHDPAGPARHVAAAHIAQIRAISPAPAPKQGRRAHPPPGRGLGVGQREETADLRRAVGLLGPLRGSSASAGYSCGTTRRPMNRRFVRSVRRATGDRPGAHRVNRSAADGCSSTSGTASKPSGSAQSASFAAAHSRFLG